MISTKPLLDRATKREQAKFACFLHFQSENLHRITLQTSNQFELHFVGCAKKPAVTKWFDAFFEGVLQPFPLPLDYEKESFSGKVLDLLQQIPMGETLSYKEIAVRLKSPKAARAVGNACNKNPYPLVIPCHRVLGSSGKLTGFAYGLELKQHLLDLERLT